jgi:methylamine dehydrogenase heavy chain
MFVLVNFIALPLAMAFEPEVVTLETLKPDNPYRLYLPDAALAHISDGKIVIVDGAKMKVEGNVGAGFSGLTTLSPDRKEIYIATTYYSRLSRGVRTELLEIYDALTLKPKAEIPIPPKHAQALSFRGMIRTTTDGHYVLVQNATPATSVTVVDVINRKFLFEVQTPGCWSVVPSYSNPKRFSTLCGDGTMLTISFDESGKVTSQKRSQKFFDADIDPVFAPAQNIEDDYVFISFKGVVHPVNLEGDVATFGKIWDLVSKPAERKANWRPGGYQFFAIHTDSKRLYVAMHPNGHDGTHKTPAKEIWVFDLATQKRIARLPGNNALAVAVSQGQSPKLFVLDAMTAGLVNVSLEGKPRVIGRIDGVVEIPVAIEVQ